jgi:hypothetical protein
MNQSSAVREPHITNFNMISCSEDIYISMSSPEHGFIISDWSNYPYDNSKTDMSDPASSISTRSTSTSRPSSATTAASSISIHKLTNPFREPLFLDRAELEKTPIARLNFPFDVEVPDPRDPTHTRQVTIEVSAPRALDYILNKDHKLFPLKPKREDRPFRVFGDPGLPSRYKTPPAYMKPLETCRPSQATTPNTGVGTSTTYPTPPTSPSTEEFTTSTCSPLRRPNLPKTRHGIGHLKHRFEDFGEKMWEERAAERIKGLVCGGTCNSCGHMWFPDNRF